MLDQKIGTALTVTAMFWVFGPLGVAIYGVALFVEDKFVN